MILLKKEFLYTADHSHLGLGTTIEAELWKQFLLGSLCLESMGSRK